MTTLRATLALVDDTWHFAGLKLEGTQLAHVTFYLDGANETPGGNTTVLDMTLSDNVYVGAQDLNGASKYIKLAYLLVYDRALSDAEVEQNRQALKSILAARGIALP